MPGAGTKPGQQIEARRHLAKTGEMVLDQKRAVIAECFGLDIVVNKVAEALAAVGIGPGAPGLRTAEQSKFHCVLLIPLSTERCSKALSTPLHPKGGERGARPERPGG